MTCTLLNPAAFICSTLQSMAFANPGDPLSRGPDAVAKIRQPVVAFVVGHRRVDESVGRLTVLIGQIGGAERGQPPGKKAQGKRSIKHTIARLSTSPEEPVTAGTHKKARIE